MRTEPCRSASRFPTIWLPPSRPWDKTPRAALETLGLNAYRERRLTGYQLRTLLGITLRFEFDAFLKNHRVEKYTAQDFDHDLATLG